MHRYHIYQTMDQKEEEFYISSNFYFLKINLYFKFYNKLPSDSKVSLIALKTYNSSIILLKKRIMSDAIIFDKSTHNFG
jgi:hypothetical protein